MLWLLLKYIKKRITPVKIVASINRKNDFRFRNNLIATGDAMGCIQVFRISDSLKTPLSRDLEILGDLVDITTES